MLAKSPINIGKIMSKNDFTKPEDIQKEFEKMVKEKFGSNVQVVTQAFEPSSDPIDRKDDASKSEQSRKDRKAIHDILSFNKVPQDLKNSLDEFIISQDEAKKALSIAICDHYNQVKYFHSLNEQEKADHIYSKQNVLLLGPTGVGKTYMVKQIAKEIGVPFVKADATKYSETGYMGANVEDLMKDLLQQANGNIGEAEFGIVYIDEADKLATRSSKHHGKDVNGRGVQLSLLKMMEETEVDLRASNDPSSQMQAFMDMQRSGGKLKKKVMNTRHILFILSGAFTDLEEIIEKRVANKSIGFDISTSNTGKKSTDISRNLATEDLIEYGLEPEFVGRLPIRVSCESLTVDNLFHILKDSKGSILNQYVRAFDAYGIEIEFTDNALREVAKKAHLENTGARSLITILEKALRNFKFYLPSNKISKLTVDENLIRDPDARLQDILSERNTAKDCFSKEIRKFERKFFEDHGIEISFNDKACDEIIEACSKLSHERGASNLHSFLKSKLVGYEYGLKLVQQNSGTQNLILNENCIKDPKRALENWIKESYASSLEAATGAAPKEPKAALN